MTTAIQLEIHPLAEFFPPMTDEEFDKLKKSIVEHGVQEPIALLDGKVLDGRNRERACRELGIDPPTVEVELKPGETPLDYVIRRNLIRRHLTVGQRATLALEIEKLYAEDAKKNPPPANLPEDFDAPNRPPPPRRRENESREKAAKALGVSGRSVGTAKRLTKEAPELAKQVASGKLSLNRATRSLPPTQRPGLPKTEWFKLAITRLRTVLSEAEVKAETRLGRELRMSQLKSCLKDAIEIIKFAEPHSACPCGGKTAKCQLCEGSGWVNAEKAKRAAKKNPPPGRQS